ncbi:response regulator transcription factor [Shewanella mesophila]|uniref:response regulator n=1 Tax=Shewanella mesophila TaxID=2864208 RepID=UPI001C658EE6|nr:response regulator transcription factor [Shewanella mesophila]QYJ85135.1 response regulator transcription factor [Shewanella mesophila]
MHLKTSAITLGLVDDQKLIRQGIASLLSLSDKVNIVWQAENGRDAINALEQQPVQLILSDIRMPVLDGIEMLKIIRAKPSAVPIIMLTTFDDNALFVASIKYGANGFLLKDVSLDKLITAIIRVANGGYLIETDILNQIIKQPGTQIDTGSLGSMDISEREKEILTLMAGGYANKEIATAVYLAEGTVKNHISNILIKLGSRDRTQAVVKALQLAII